uniref:Hematopoietic SH2 domain containing n=1 Tax=Papio anubis TaxID=9555 RepID=A0A8I5NN58_PAPAN
MWHQMLCWTADRVTWSVLVPPPGLTCLKKQELPQGSQLRPIDVQTLNRNPGFCRHWYSYSEGLGRPRISQVTFPQPQEAMTEARKPPPLLPPRLDWFVHTQVGQLAQDGVPEWFHGAISREDAEDLLESQPLGSFLIRVSHSHVGYTLSYKAQSSCCHFMVKLLDDGTFIIPGEKVAHTSLDALVTFHQQNPIEPRRELLTQPCRQKDPANVDYEDLFLYSNAVAEAATCPVSAPEEASPKPVLRHQSKERKPSSEMNRVTTEEATSSCPPKTPLGETRQKLWRSLKMLPQRGQRVRQQLKSHLVAVSLPSLLDVRRSTVISGPGTGKGVHTRTPGLGRAGERPAPGGVPTTATVCPWVLLENRSTLALSSCYRGAATPECPNISSMAPHHGIRESSGTRETERRCFWSLFLQSPVGRAGYFSNNHQSDADGSGCLLCVSARARPSIHYFTPESKPLR